MANNNKQSRLTYGRLTCLLGSCIQYNEWIRMGTFNWLLGSSAWLWRTWKCPWLSPSSCFPGRFILPGYSCYCGQLLSRIRLFVTPWTIARQALLSMGILQGRILEWVAISFSWGSSGPRDWISNPSHQHCRLILYHLSHLGSPQHLKCHPDTGDESTLWLLCGSRDSDNKEQINFWVGFSRNACVNVILY